nr:MAG TPA: hypothetical protein [Microviridae sp.]
MPFATRKQSLFNLFSSVAAKHLEYKLAKPT